MKALPNIGAMRQRITIEERTDAIDDVGGRVPTWTPVDDGEDLAAQVRPASAWERSQFAHDVGGVSHVVTLRAPGFAISKANRIAYAGRVLEIRAVIGDELGRFVQVNADEVVTGGGGSDGE